MRSLARNALPALVAIAAALALLVPVGISQPQHGDEDQYVWSSAYYGGKISRLDFNPGSSDWLSDPGWAPPSFWNVTQPMGSRAIFAVALGLTKAEIPAVRESYSPEESSADELMARNTLLVARLAAISCAAVGFGLIALRLGWSGLIPMAMLAFPQVRSDFARAWAEGPLLLGLGLAAMAYGSRWFPLIAGLTATFKLTGLGLWPLVFWHSSFGHSIPRRLLGVAASAAVWTFLTPPAWFAGGPAFLLVMLLDRKLEYAHAAAGGGGLFAPSRYFWPAELAVLLGFAVALPWLKQHGFVHIGRKAVAAEPALGT